MAINKAQKIVVGFFVISALVIVGLYFLSLSSDNNLPEGITLYYSFTCPHCKIVEDFMKNNSIESKINITQKEVSLNQANAKELIAAGKVCKIQSDYIGAVPLLYNEGICYLGDVDIINFLKNEVGIK